MSALTANNFSGNCFIISSGVEDFAENTKEKLEDFAEQAKEKLSDAADKAEDFAKDALGKLKGMFGNDDKKEGTA